MPYTSWTEGRGGACLDPGNAAIGGGFSDLDSIVPFGELPTDAFFFESLATSVRILQDTSTALMMSGESVTEAASLIALRYIWALLEKSVDEEARPGLSLDPRVRQVLSPDYPLETLRTLVARTQPSSYASFAKKKPDGAGPTSIAANQNPK
jgi:hypothetical protein